MTDPGSHGVDATERPLFLVVTIRPRPDRRKEAEDQLQSMRRNAVREPGCVFMHLTQPQDDPQTWVMLEMFRSRAAWDEHMVQPYNVEGNLLLADLLAEPSDLRLLDDLTDGTGPAAGTAPADGVDGVDGVDVTTRRGEVP